MKTKMVERQREAFVGDYALTVREKVAPLDPGETTPLRWWDWLVHRKDASETAARGEDVWEHVAEGVSWRGCIEAQASAEAVLATSRRFDDAYATCDTFFVDSIPTAQRWAEVEPD